MVRTLPHFLFRGWCCRGSLGEWLFATTPGIGGVGGMGRKGCLNQDFQDFRMIRIIGGDGLVRVDGMDILCTGLLPCTGSPVETTHALSPTMVARSTKIGDLPHPFLPVT
jgi:hypothetical protein